MSLGKSLYKTSLDYQFRRRDEEDLRQKHQTLQREVEVLRDQVAQKREALEQEQERRRQRKAYEHACAKLATLTDADLSGARSMLRQIHANYPDLIRRDPFFQQRVQQFLDAETDAFKRRLDAIEV